MSFSALKGMNFSALMRELRSKQFWFSWLGVLFGAFVLAAGFVLFTNPYDIVPGGVYGLGCALHKLVPSIATGTFGLMMDIPLMIIGFLIFGTNFGANTVFAALISPVFINAMTALVGDSTAVANGVGFLAEYLNFSDNLLIPSIFGGVVIGVGVGLIVKFGATSGGTDIISMIVSKFLHMKFGTAVLIVESLVVIISMIILRDWQMPLYALIAIFAQSKAIDFVLGGVEEDKLLFIISEKQEELKDYILNDLERGGTYIKSKGMYTGNDKEMIFVVVAKRQITTVQDSIKTIDPDAFVVIVSAQDTYGDGFMTFPK